MKIRSNYVSNSSTCSFLVSKDVSDFAPCIKLPEEIWKAIEKYYIDSDLVTKYNLSNISNEWWLTTLISDSSKEYDKLFDLLNKEKAYIYLEGHEVPYDWYDNPKSYTVFKTNWYSFYVKNHDLFGFNEEDIPSCIYMKNKLTKILNNSYLNKTQKINAIKDYLQLD